MQNTSTTQTEKIYASPSEYAKDHYLYLQEAGTLTSLKPHISRRDSLNSCLFLIVTEGSGNVVLPDKTCTLSAGDLMLIDCRKGYAHESSASSPWSLSWVHFYGKLSDSVLNVFQKTYPKGIAHPGNLPEILTAHRAILQAGKVQGDSVEFHMHCLLHRLLDLALTDTAAPPATPFEGIASKALLIRDYIFSNYSDPITLSSLCDRFYVSKYYLEREYHRLFGITVGHELTGVRISHSKELLRYSEENMEQIALRCGFDNASYFSKVFKKEEGITPRQYRAGWRNRA